MLCINFISHVFLPSSFVLMTAVPGNTPLAAAAAGALRRPVF
jgi:hypothetical protein